MTNLNQQQTTNCTQLIYLSLKCIPLKAKIHQNKIFKIGLIPFEQIYQKSVKFNILFKSLNKSSTKSKKTYKTQQMLENRL